MLYADCPTVDVDVLIDAPIERVWQLVTDIELPARFSSEFLGATWLDEGPRVGARFVGRNQPRRDRRVGDHVVREPLSSRLLRSVGA